MHHFVLRISLDSFTLIIYKIIVDDLIEHVNVCLCICMSFYGVLFGICDKSASAEPHKSPEQVEGAY